ncbi:nucleoporin NUP42 [Hyperolius riggenbachi]|uniref:nucleoporin NUP42 n=1 Tax=Hyperolius riggenbachi TaxID=752182 RepID=UPI0035A3A29F
MPVCRYFLEGHCRFGDRCWNEHPRGGRQQQGRYPQQQPTGGSRSWGSSNQQRYVQPSTTWTRDNRTTYDDNSAASRSWGSSNQRYVQQSNFSKSTTWTKDNRTYDDNRSKNYSSGPSAGHFSSQNRFSALPQQDFSRDTQSDKDGNLLDDIKHDLDAWESSGQWIFSVCCVNKVNRNLIGFADISPEELRLEYYTAQSTGKLNDYMNSIQQLVNQWKKRIADIRNMNPLSQAALIDDLTKPPSGPVPTFGGQPAASGFGSSGPAIQDTASSAVSFSFKPDSQTAAPMAGPLPTFPTAPGFGNQPTTGFGNPASAAASFTFAVTAASDVSSSGFGTSKAATSAAAFSFAPTKASGFGASDTSGFGLAATSSQPMSASSTGTSLFGATALPPSGFGGNASAVPGFGVAPSSSIFGGSDSSSGTSGFGAKPSAVSDLFKAGAAASAASTPFGQAPGSSMSLAASVSSSSTADGNPLYTSRSALSAEELSQFESKKFTLGKVPLLPPPVDLLVV